MAQEERRTAGQPERRRRASSRPQSARSGRKKGGFTASFALRYVVFVIGVSALVPVVGAYVGAITSALLLVMVDPIDALIFLIFLVCLQQIEGNVIYPRVVGTSLGLPGIWVLTAVTVGGGLFDLAGVLLSVPVASILYALLKRDVRKRLARQEKTGE